MMAHFQHIDAAIDWLQAHAQASAQLCSDSRLVRPGDIFLAWPGHAGDGRSHIAAALQAGAAAILIEADAGQAEALPQIAHAAHAGVALASFEGLFQASGLLAASWYGQPSRAMDIVAITGTNGKTTVAWWLSKTMSQLGQPCAYIGTLGIQIGAQLQPTGLTSPQALQLQQALSQMQQQAVKACAIEASSIGLDQGRLDGTAIQLAVFTNFTQDHLDYHGTMQAYGLAKRALFQWPGLQSAIINVQDSFGAQLAQELLQQAQVNVWTTALQADGLPVAGARLEASQLSFARGQACFTVTEYERALSDASSTQARTIVGIETLSAPVVGLYNVQNALAVLASLRALGYSLAVAAQALATLPAVAGRMQVVQTTKQDRAEDSAVATEPLVVVDYAHTPDALRAALQALRPVAQQRQGQLQLVFGCGGDRDSSKRPLMAMAAAQNADRIWITSDNPRSEPPEQIIEQIVQGLTATQRALAQCLTDRSIAIEQAIAQAQPEDVVLIAGKGHEPYQEVKGVKHPFSDGQQAEQALLNRMTAAPQVGHSYQNKEVSA